MTAETAAMSRAAPTNLVSHTSSPARMAVVCHMTLSATETMTVGTGPMNSSTGVVLQLPPAPRESSGVKMDTAFP